MRTPFKTLFSYHATIQKQTPPWVVFTGAPCSGKTTVAEELQRLGYLVIPDVSRVVVEEELAVKGSVKNIPPKELSDKILERMYRVENSLRQMQNLILDRALPDSIAFRSFKNQDLSALNDIPMFNRYRLVLIFEPVAFVQDGYRDDKERDSQVKITDLMEKVYQSFNYEVKRIPLLPINERVDLVREQLELNNILR